MSFTPTPRDPALDAIVALVRQYDALPPARLRKQETPAHRDLVTRIRAAVDAWKKGRGDEMVVIATGCV